ncbi:MAG: glucuronate isomerase [Treponemataceae bacterium]|nr:MAG: glucuronate isomerase [Treponemataceae bacterium]
MAERFLGVSFLLESKTAIDLYFYHAKDAPIFDYHCHLIPEQIAQNKRFADMSEVWLAGDHYKWRQMRTFGVREELITGNAAPYDKFVAWAETVENLIGNPLYHWTHLELQRFFDIHEPLSKKTAPEIWEQANAQLKTLCVKDIFERMNVYAVGTTDDPCDTLEYHKAIKDGSAAIGKIKTRVLPSFRPDKALNIEQPSFKDYIEKLSAVSGIKISTADDVIAALEKRLDHFASLGCRAADHGLEYPPLGGDSDSAINSAFSDAMSGKSIAHNVADSYKAKILAALGAMYAKRDIVMQLHFSAIRNVNSAMVSRLGPDTGYDAVHDNQASAGLAQLLDRMQQDGGTLPKTILYSLNAKDYYPFATIMGAFQGGEKPVRGKIQLGSAWWFYDHRDGMEEQMRVLGNLGMLPLFVGMLTDSRSFLSYPRHEYFRRILCNLLGRWVENGEYPNDIKKLGSIVRNISFDNAKSYFG